MTLPVALPEILEHEDGEQFFSPGHVDKSAFALALILYLAECVDNDTALAPFANPNGGIDPWPLLDRIRYVYMCYSDPNNDEIMKLCLHTQEGALPFTLVYVD